MVDKARRQRANKDVAGPMESEMAAAERRIADRLSELERAQSEGRLREVVKDVPSVDEQLRSFIEEESRA